MKRVLSLLVDDNPGVLSRISGLFSRRCYNVDSITAGVTADPRFTRITIVTSGDELILSQIEKQVRKLEDVVEIKVLAPEESVFRELIMVKISETEELVEREKKIDQLRWNWMEEATFFNYFTVERLFVFLLQLEMIERWISLDKEKGNQLFRSIIATLKDEVQIPAEFR